MVHNLNPNCAVLLQLLAKGLFHSEISVDWESVDLKEIYKEARAQSVVAVAFDALPPEVKELAPEVYAHWRNASFAVTHRTLANNYANVQLTELLDKHNIRHSTIKGYASAYFYPNGTLRQMGDIDFLVYPQEVDRAQALLLENGFTFVEIECDRHVVLAKDNVVYEMHNEVTTVPAGKEFVLKSLDDLIADSICVDSPCGTVRIPSIFHHGVVMLLHMQRHMFNGSGIGLRHLGDWAVFVNAIDNDEFVSVFERKLKEIGLWKFARAISKAAGIYLKMPEKAWFASADEAIAGALINDIIDGGNFGRKNELRKTQQMFIDHNHNDRNIVVRVFSSITKRVYECYPFCDKCKILLPVGYVAYLSTILFKMVFRKKKYHTLEALKKGNEQFDMYSKMRFFEAEK